MAGGKSSRFGGNPKILETFERNKFLKNYFNVFIVTSKDIYSKIQHLDSDFIIQEMGNGSGKDVFNLFQKIKEPAFVAWSDVFYTEAAIKDIIDVSENGENCMTLTKRENAYVSIYAENRKITQYKKDENNGYQDNSIFYIKELYAEDEEFMDMAIKNGFYVHETKNKCEFFNTKEELSKILV
jgi:GTP:adenosylcobinamide-phosphate guanylyltransferase